MKKTSDRVRALDQKLRFEVYFSLGAETEAARSGQIHGVLDLARSLPASGVALSPRLSKLSTRFRPSSSWGEDVSQAGPASPISQ